MKVLQITNKIPIPARDGGSIASLRLSTGMVKLGHDVTVMAMNTSKHFIDKDLWGPLSEKAGFRLLPIKMNTDIKAINGLGNLLFSRLPYTGVRFLSKEFQQELESLLKKESFDFVIIENLYPFLYIKSIRKFSRAKIVMRAHNVEHEIWERTASNTKGVKGLYLANLAKRIKRFELKLINNYDYLAPITHRDLLAFNKLGNQKPSTILQTGISINSSSKKIDHNKIMEIAHLGALDWAPNQDGLMWFIKEVWPLVLKQIPEMQFNIAGRNAPVWFEKELKNHNVKYHGEVLSASDFTCTFPIHIVPLWSGSGMRIKIIEAMSQARIIVTTPIGVEGINAVNDEALIIRDKPEDFAQAIIDLVNKPELVDKISQNAFTFVEENFENTNLVKGFIRFIENDDSSC